MIKKIISLFTLLTLTVFSFSCHAIKTKHITHVVGAGNRVEYKILSVVKTSGELIVFSKGEPGEMINNAIVGRVIGKEGVKKTISIPFSEIKLVRYKRISQGKNFLLAFVFTSITWSAIWLGLLVSALGE